MSDLVEWLTSILDEQEETATEADGERFYLDEGDATGRFLEQVTPAWVLADIAAKRAILGIYRDFLEGPMPTSGWESGQLKAIAKAVQHIASSYADRPGYDERWWL